MPFYNYKCLDCEETTEIQASWQAKENGLQINCKSCDSKNTRHVFGQIATTGKAKSPIAACGKPKEQAMSDGCGGSCACH